MYMFVLIFVNVFTRVEIIYAVNHKNQYGDLYYFLISLRGASL